MKNKENEFSIANYIARYRVASQKNKAEYNVLFILLLAVFSITCIYCFGYVIGKAFHHFTH